MAHVDVVGYCGYLGLGSYLSGLAGHCIPYTVVGTLTCPSGRASKMTMPNDSYRFC